MDAGVSAARVDVARGFRSELRTLRADVGADYDAILEAQAKYRGEARRAPLLVAMVQKIGLQMMVSYRVMRFFRAIGWTFVAKVLSRRIRRAYGAEIHWDTELAPGVMIVHGTGLVLSHAARVGPRCILFQHVTLGVNIDPTTRETGAPMLEANVHVGPGAVLLGPIVIGAGTKITANAVLTHSVPPNSRVITPEPIIHRLVVE